MCDSEFVIMKKECDVSKQFVVSTFYNAFRCEPTPFYKSMYSFPLGRYLDQLTHMSSMFITYVVKLLLVLQIPECWLSGVTDLQHDGQRHIMYATDFQLNLLKSRKQ